MNLIPYHDFDARFGYPLEQAARDSVEHHRKTRNSFWLSHRLLQSRVRLYAGSVYTGMTDPANVDISFFGCILLHLRDPLLALSRFAKITREKIIITDMHEQVGLLADVPVMLLRANAADRGNPVTWWYLSPVLLRQFLGVLGFPKCTVTFHQAWSVLGKRNAELFTLVAER